MSLVNKIGKKLNLSIFKKISALFLISLLLLSTFKIIIEDKLVPKIKLSDISLSDDNLKRSGIFYCSNGNPVTYNGQKGFLMVISNPNGLNLKFRIYLYDDVNYQSYDPDPKVISMEYGKSFIATGTNFGREIITDASYAIVFLPLPFSDRAADISLVFSNVQDLEKKGFQFNSINDCQKLADLLYTSFLLSYADLGNKLLSDIINFQLTLSSAILEGILRYAQGTAVLAGTQTNTKIYLSNDIHQNARNFIYEVVEILKENGLEPGKDFWIVEKKFNDYEYYTLEFSSNAKNKINKNIKIIFAGDVFDKRQGDMEMDEFKEKLDKRVLGKLDENAKSNFFKNLNVLGEKREDIGKNSRILSHTILSIMDSLEELLGSDNVIRLLGNHDVYQYYIVDSERVKKLTVTMSHSDPFTRGKDLVEYYWNKGRLIYVYYEDGIVNIYTHSQSGFLIKEFLERLAKSLEGKNLNELSENELKRIIKEVSEEFDRNAKFIAGENSEVGIVKYTYERFMNFEDDVNKQTTNVNDNLNKLSEIIKKKFGNRFKFVIITGHTPVSSLNYYYSSPNIDLFITDNPEKRASRSLIIFDKEKISVRVIPHGVDYFVSIQKPKLNVGGGGLSSEDVKKIKNTKSQIDVAREINGGISKAEEEVEKAKTISERLDVLKRVFSRLKDFFSKKSQEVDRVFIDPEPTQTRPIKQALDASIQKSEEGLRAVQSGNLEEANKKFDEIRKEFKQLAENILKNAGDRIQEVYQKLQGNSQAEQSLNKNIEESIRNQQSELSKQGENIQRTAASTDVAKSVTESTEKLASSQLSQQGRSLLQKLKTSVSAFKTFSTTINNLASKISPLLIFVPMIEIGRNLELYEIPYEEEVSLALTLGGIIGLTLQTILAIKIALEAGIRVALAVVIIGPFGWLSLLVLAAIIVAIGAFMCFIYVTQRGGGDFGQCLLYGISFGTAKYCDLYAAKYYFRDINDFDKKTEKQKPSEYTYFTVLYPDYREIKLYAEGIPRIGTEKCPADNYLGPIKVYEGHNYFIRIKHLGSNMERYDLTKFIVEKDGSGRSEGTFCLTSKSSCSKDATDFPFEVGKQYLVIIDERGWYIVEPLGSGIKKSVPVGVLYIYENKNACSNLGGKCVDVSKAQDPKQIIYHGVCKAGEICIKECKSDSDCSSGYFCDAGICKSRIGEEVKKCNSQGKVYIGHESENNKCCEREKVNVMICEGSDCPTYSFRAEEWITHKDTILDYLTGKIDYSQFSNLVSADVRLKLLQLQSTKNIMCCGDWKKCVYNGKCYNENSVEKINQKDFVCKLGKWIQIDSCKINRAYVQNNNLILEVSLGCGGIISGNQVNVGIECKRINKDGQCV